LHYFIPVKDLAQAKRATARLYVDMKITKFHARSSLSQPCRTSAATFGVSTPIVPALCE
jgi:hypothetical protein